MKTLELNGIVELSYRESTEIHGGSWVDFVIGYLADKLIENTLGAWDSSNPEITNTMSNKIANGSPY